MQCLGRAVPYTGQWPVASGQLSVPVASGQWPVAISQYQWP
eukprot:SAG11_NODE_21047_length_433_cov_0.769461_1_plen_40_part_10